MWCFADTAANQTRPLSIAFAMNALPLAMAMGTGIDARTLADKALHLEPSGSTELRIDVSQPACKYR
jgi:hypothetical protein